MASIVRQISPDGTGVAAALAGTGRDDVVLVVGADAPAAVTIERLAAAAAETTVATASALPGAAGGGGAARTARIPAPLPGATLVKRAALDLIGVPEDLAALGRACSALGLGHVLAAGAVVEGTPPAAEDPESPLARAASSPERTLDVTIDARALGAYRAGTQVHTLHLIEALRRLPRIRLRVITPPDLHEDAVEALRDVETVPYEVAARGGLPVSDVVHRPSQVFTPDDLRLIVPLGRRLVVFQHDLIAFHSPAYHEDEAALERFRATTRLALACADHVAFPSAHAMHDALAEELVAPERASVVHNGADHLAAPAPQRPDGIPDGPYLLTLGTDLPHKNLPFAERLAERIGLPLVRVGPDSRPVSEAEKAWLLTNAAAVLYPTLAEGFGFIPFEAGAAGVPCAFAPVASLAEVLPREAAVLVPWDLEASAPALRPLLEPGPAREEHVALLRRAAAAYTWERAAQAFATIYARVLEQPPVAVRGEFAQRMEVLSELERSTHERQEEFKRFEAERAALGDAADLAHALEPRDQRALLAVAQRRTLARPVLGLARGLYRAGRALRRE